jgi:hypothetical protein
MLSTFSLGVLISISKHAALAPFVKHVVIGLDGYNHPRSGDRSWAGMEQCEAFRNAWADHHTLISSGRGLRMLVQAFQNLPNLATVGIRDYDAPGRTRDEDRWRSYGAPTLFRQTGIRNRGCSSEYATDVYTLLVQALADSNTPVQAIQVILRAQGLGLSDFAFFAPTDLRPIANRLQQLLLTIDFGEHMSIISPKVHVLGQASGT